MNELSFAGKTVVVTGGVAGIGRATAEAFAARGAAVTVADVDADGLRAFEESAGERGWKLRGECCDVCDGDAVAALFAGVAAQHGALDVLVNNVGDILGIIKPLEEMSDADIDAVYRVVLRQVFVCTRSAIPLLRAAAPGSSVVTVSSIEGYRGLPNLVPYATFKLGLEGFTKSLALELGPAGIRVNAVAPETTETRQIRPSEWIAPEHQHRVAGWIPLGRFGAPEDTAGCVLFLASELAAWVTGTTVHCDGGALAAAGWVRTEDGRWTNTPIVAGSGIDL